MWQSDISIFKIALLCMFSKKKGKTHKKGSNQNLWRMNGHRIFTTVTDVHRTNTKCGVTSVTWYTSWLVSSVLIVASVTVNTVSIGAIFPFAALLNCKIMKYIYKFSGLGLNTHKILINKNLGQSAFSCFQNSKFMIKLPSVAVILHKTFANGKRTILFEVYLNGKLEYILRSTLSETSTG